MNNVFYKKAVCCFFNTLRVYYLYICSMVISSKKIKEQRIQKGISQVDMAKAAGMSRSAYIAFENRNETENKTETLSLTAAFGIAKALGISFNELFEIEVFVTNVSGAAGELEKLQERVKELEKRITEKDNLISLLQNENKWVKYENALNRILKNFTELINDEMYFEKTKDAKRIPIIEFRKENLKEIIDSYVSAGYPDEKDLLKILFTNIYFIQFYENKSASKDEFIKSCALYLNKFFKVDEQAVEKFVKINLITKWDPSSSFSQNDYFSYWRDVD